jgi:hypothetical protein
VDDFLRLRPTSEFGGPAHTPRLPEVTALVRGDDVEAGGQAEAHSWHEWVRKSHAGQIQVGVRAQERAYVAL